MKNNIPTQAAKGRVLLPPCPKSSLFVCQVYYNENHYTSGVQNIGRYWSLDFQDEREGLVQYQTINEYNGFCRFIEFLQRLNSAGRLWRGYFYYNTILDESGKPEQITGFAGTTAKNFLTPKEKQDGLTIEEVRVSRPILTSVSQFPIELEPKPALLCGN